ncbi:hypothetical protein VTJ04DRAFT_3893 [Mycothermus thermophilus]|uniref:uncharacterized protein n=1 Tax=Humicola insolens TaxID=85995 RepID=UPI003743B2C6
MRTFGPFAAIALGLAGQASGQVTTPAVERSPLCPDDMSGWLYSANFKPPLTATARDMSMPQAAWSNTVLTTPVFNPYFAWRRSITPRHTAAKPMHGFTGYDTALAITGDESQPTATNEAGTNAETSKNAGAAGPLAGPGGGDGWTLGLGLVLGALVGIAAVAL